MIIIVPIFFISIILTISSYCVKKESLSKALFITGFILLSIFIFIAFGIIPFYLLLSISTNATEIFSFFSIILGVWSIVYTTLKVKKYLLIKKYETSDIYIRDISVKYSPAVLSYLINNKIETKKDLAATLLNLCAEKVIKLEKDIDGKIKIINLNDIERVNNLSMDEKYAYEMFTTKITRAKISTWKSKVKNRYRQFKFSKAHKITFPAYFAALCFISLLLLTIYTSITSNTSLITIWTNFYTYCLFSGIFVVAFLALKMLITLIIDLIFTPKDNFLSNATKLINLFDKNNKESTNFIDSYTKKGAIEYGKWKKFEKFIEDFTLVKEKDFESIEVLGKYLSYSIALGINKKCDAELYNKIDINYNFNENCLTELTEYDNLFNTEKAK